MKQSRTKWQRPRTVMEMLSIQRHHYRLGLCCILASAPGLGRSFSLSHHFHSATIFTQPPLPNIHFFAFGHHCVFTQTSLQLSPMETSIAKAPTDGITFNASFPAATRPKLFCINWLFTRNPNVRMLKRPQWRSILIQCNGP